VANSKSLIKPNKTISVIPTKGQLRIHEWNELWYAECWDGRSWAHIHCSKNREDLEDWLNELQVHEIIDSSATD